MTPGTFLALKIQYAGDEHAVHILLRLFPLIFLEAPEGTQTPHQIIVNFEIPEFSPLERGLEKPLSQIWGWGVGRSSPGQGGAMGTEGHRWSLHRLNMVGDEK